MTINLFLSGGGDAKQTKKLDNAFASAVSGDRRVLYIPVAMPRSKFSPSQCFEWAKKTLGGVGLIDVTMWPNLSKRNFSDLRNYDAVYIGGGNTYGLLDKLRRNDFGDLLKRYLHKGGIVYGGSAGAIIFGRDIETAGFGGDSDRNFLGMTDFRGLNMLGGFSLHAHYSKSDDQAIKDYVAQKGIPTIALPEPSGIHFTGTSGRVIGAEPAVLFRKDGTIKVIKNGGRVKLK